MSAPHPFLYYGHGCAYARKCLEVVVLFDQPVPESRRRSLARRIPAPLTMFVSWGTRWLHCGSDDTYRAE